MYQMLIDSEPQGQHHDDFFLELPLRGTAREVGQQEHVAEGIIITVGAVAVVFIAVTVPLNSSLSLLVLTLSLYTKKI